jgi:uncharacterized membrane protein YhaH (DUF805 family)
MSFYDTYLSDGEVLGAMVTVGIICVALITPNICVAIRRWGRK